VNLYASKVIAMQGCIARCTAGYRVGCLLRSLQIRDSRGGVHRSLGDDSVRRINFRKGVDLVGLGRTNIGDASSGCALSVTKVVGRRQRRCTPESAVAAAAAAAAELAATAPKMHSSVIPFGRLL